MSGEREGPQQRDYAGEALPVGKLRDPIDDGREEGQPLADLQRLGQEFDASSAHWEQRARQTLAEHARANGYPLWAASIEKGDAPYFNKVMVDALLAIALSERNAERERCAGIAEAKLKIGGAAGHNWIVRAIATAIRSNQDAE